MPALAAAAALPAELRLSIGAFRCSVEAKSLRVARKALRSAEAAEPDEGATGARGAAYAMAMAAG